ncbi:unnamed protein product, partial [Allacma fusca]
PGGQQWQKSNKTASPGDSNYTELKVGLIKSDLLVDSASDLKELTAEQDTITIQSLNEDYTESYSFTMNENLNVKNFKINGPIFIQWIRFLFRKLHAITSLDIDSNGLCSVGMKYLNSFTFKSVDHFGLRNLFHCNDISWINKCHFPRIKSLEISNADLTEKNFKSIHMFLDKHRKTLFRGVFQLKTTLLENCNRDEEIGSEHLTISGVLELKTQNQDESFGMIRKKNKITFRISRLKIFVIMMILLIGLAAVGILNNVSLSTSDKSSLLATAKPIESNYKEPKVEPNHKNLRVDSPTDLKELTTEQDTIIIETLNENNTDIYSFIISENANVKNLKIDGPISIKWLRLLLLKFPAISTLSIDSDDLCPVDMKDLDGFNFGSVENFGICNLFRCQDIEWINKCHFPRIKRLEIRNADLTEKRFKSIHTFLNKNRKSVKEISEKNCFICKSCTFLDITYGQMSVTISGTRGAPKFDL